MSPWAAQRAGQCGERERARWGPRFSSALIPTPATAVYPPHTAPRTMKRPDCCGVCVAPDGIVHITCKFSITWVPSLGHQDSSATVLEPIRLARAA